MKIFSVPLPKTYKYALLAAGIVCISIAWLLFCQTLPWYNETDWTPIRRGVIDIIGGKNPYSEGLNFFNPPWLALLLTPLAILPENIGGQLNTLIGFFAFAYVAYRLKANLLTTVIFLLSPPVIISLAFSNIDWIPALGLILPPQIGLFFIMTKPQIGIGVSIYWLVMAYQTGGIGKVIKTFFPISAAFLLSFAIYGLYPLQANRLVSIWWNTSMWPASIPIGLALLAYALRNRRFGFAIMAGPLLSQYLSFNSWTFVMLGLLPETIMTIVAFAGYWVFYTLRPTPP
jgi:hypothetical protein